MKLEHMRFKEKFRYEIVVEPNVNSSDVKLPAMMLQPYVENSIWHGILPMERQGHVRIRVAAGAPGRVQVHIADDGIGVVRSRSLKNGADGDHISRGIDITKGRADVLRELHVTDIRITGPVEVLQEDGTPAGTTVTIDLPYNHPPHPAGQDLQDGPTPLIFEER